MKDLKNHYRNIVIGFGKGGKTLAAYLAIHGQEVAVIEQSEMMYGGTCINVACIPSKSLDTCVDKNNPYYKAIDIKHNLTAYLRQKNYDILYTIRSISITSSQARFLPESEIGITHATNNTAARVTRHRIFANTE